MKLLLIAIAFALLGGMLIGAIAANVHLAGVIVERETKITELSEKARYDAYYIKQKQPACPYPAAVLQDTRQPLR